MKKACVSIARSQPKYTNSVPIVTSLTATSPAAHPPSTTAAPPTPTPLLCKDGQSPGLPAVVGPSAGASRPGVPRLPRRADRAFFTAVCRAWCTAARQCRLPPPSPVPWLVRPDGSASSFLRGDGDTFRIPDGVRHHTSCGEWLLMSRRDGSCFLMNHFTKDTMPLPSLSSYSYYQEPVDISEYIGFEFPLPRLNSTEPEVLSLVVCSMSLVAAILEVGGLCTIALCRPGAASWSVSAHSGCIFLSSMVFFQGKLYAIDKNMFGVEHPIAINIVDQNDSDEPKVSRIRYLKFRGAELPLQKHSCFMRYLVESHGKLLLIRRERSDKGRNGIVVAGSNKCQVFEADFEQLLWDEVRTLGNSQALFVGQRYSRAVHVSPYDVSRDCVFFVDDYPNCVVKKTAESCGIYDMKDKKVYSLPMVSWKSGKVPATWIFSQGETDKLQTEAEY